MGIWTVTSTRWDEDKFERKSRKCGGLGNNCWWPLRENPSGKCLYEECPNTWAWLDKNKHRFEKESDNE